MSIRRLTSLLSMSLTSIMMLKMREMTSHLTMPWRSSRTRLAISADSCNRFPGPPKPGLSMWTTHEMRIQQRVNRRLCLPIVRARHADHERVRPDIEVIAEIPVQRAACVTACIGNENEVSA